MRILLVYPYFLEPRLQPEEIAAPPMGLFYVAAALRQAGFQVAIADWHQARGRPDEIRAALRKWAPQLIGISVLHANRWGALEIAELAKKELAGVPVIFGGIGASFLWRHLLTHFPQVDAVVLGEGEQTMVEVARAVERHGSAAVLEDIEGLALRGGQGPFVTGTRGFVQDLDSLPMPARFFSFQHLAMTRGCPGRCTFCGSPAFWGRKVRSHSPEYFVSQIQHLAQGGVRHLMVSDDTFTLDRCRVMEVCRRLEALGLPVTWQAISKVNAVDAKTLAAMRKAGCIQISYGIESGDAGIRRRLKKDIGDEQIRRAFALTTEAGILARAYFIYGSPGETDATVQASCRLMDAVAPLGAVFYVMTLFPGTALYEAFLRRTGRSDDIWLERIEDIAYVDTDDRMTRDQVLAWGKRLREHFAARLPEYARRIRLAPDKDLAPLQADFLSRLAMTFSHGDYAGLVGDQAMAVAEHLLERALALAPDLRAFWAAALIALQQGRRRQAEALARQGLAHHPASRRLAQLLEQLQGAGEESRGAAGGR